MALNPLSSYIQSVLTSLTFLKMYKDVVGVVNPIDVTGNITIDADTHAGAFLKCNVTSPSAIQITLPDDLEDNVCFQIVKKGTGNVTFAKSGSATINGGTDNITVSTQYSQAYVVHVGSGEWYASGKDI